MILRYSGSVGAGTVITAALILGMQQLIGTGEMVPEPYPPFRFAGPVHLPPPPPPPRPPKEPPPRPQATVAPPDTPPLAIDPVPGPTGPIAPLGPPLIRGPLGIEGHGIGGSGAWIGAGELLLVSRATPPYPQAALMRDLDGTVLLEFTVTTEGSVRDARIVESSDRVFDRAALAAVMRFRYQPRVIDGTPVEVDGVRAAISFELHN